MPFTILSILLQRELPSICVLSFPFAGQLWKRSSFPCFLLPLTCNFCTVLWRGFLGLFFIAINIPLLCFLSCYKKILVMLFFFSFIPLLSSYSSLFLVFSLFFFFFISLSTTLHIYFRSIGVQRRGRALCQLGFTRRVSKKSQIHAREVQPFLQPLWWVKCLTLCHSNSLCKNQPQDLTSHHYTVRFHYARIH